VTIARPSMPMETLGIYHNTIVNVVDSGDIPFRPSSVHNSSSMMLLPHHRGHAKKSMPSLEHSASASLLQSGPRLPPATRKLIRVPPDLALSRDSLKNLDCAEFPVKHQALPRPRGPPLNQQPWKVVAKEASSNREWAYSRLDASQKRLPASHSWSPSATGSMLSPNSPASAEPLEAPVWHPEYNSKHRYQKFHWVRDTSPLLLADLARTNDLPSARQWLEPLPWAAASPPSRGRHHPSALPHRHASSMRPPSEFDAERTPAQIPPPPQRRWGGSAAYRKSSM
jgi:hypothetical protein